MTQATQEVAAPCASGQQSVIELSDSSNQSFDCNDDRSCSSGILSHAGVKQELPDSHKSPRMARIPERFLDGVVLAASSSERYAMLPTFHHARKHKRPTPQGITKEAAQWHPACHLDSIYRMCCSLHMSQNCQEQLTINRYRATKVPRALDQLDFKPELFMLPLVAHLAVGVLT